MPNPDLFKLNWNEPYVWRITDQVLILFLIHVWILNISLFQGNWFVSFMVQVRHILCRGVCTAFPRGDNDCGIYGCIHEPSISNQYHYARIHGFIFVWGRFIEVRNNQRIVNFRYFPVNFITLFHDSYSIKFYWNWN